MTKTKSPAGQRQGLDDYNGKDSPFESQYQIVRTSFGKSPKTMLMVAVETGILRANICRFVGMMKAEEIIQEIKKGYCPYTKHIAGFYSTDSTLFGKNNDPQLQFDGYAND